MADMNELLKLKWDELAPSLQDLLKQIQAAILKEVQDREADTATLTQKIKDIFDSQGHLVFPNGNTLWVDDNSGALPGTNPDGGGGGEASNVTFDQLSDDLQDRLNKLQQQINELSTDLAAVSKSAVLNPDYANSGTIIIGPRGNQSYTFTQNAIIAYAEAGSMGQLCINGSRSYIFTAPDGENHDGDDQYGYKIAFVQKGDTVWCNNSNGNIYLKVTPLK